MYSSVCGVFVDDYVNGCWWMFYWRSNLITLGQFQGSKIPPALFQDFMDGYIKP